MDFLVIYLIIAVVGAIATVLFWGFVGTMIYKLFTSNSGDVGSFGNPDAEFARQMQQIQALVHQAQAAQGQAGGHGVEGANLSPDLQMQFQARLMGMQNEMNHFDNLSRQRHDTFVSGMLSDASAAGLDVSSWR